jgi:hypothetical protein
VVTAPGEDSNATGVNGNQSDNSAINSGAAYVFMRDGTNWSQQAYLKASIVLAAPSGEFGQSVAVSGDTVVVATGGDLSNATGVNGDQSNRNAEHSGAAYVFMRNGTNWSQQAYLKASNTGADDEFGNAVAISGGTLVAGSRGEDSNATGVNGDQNNNRASDSGAAYVFAGFGPTTPALAIEQSAASVCIAWPVPAGDFVLDEVDDLNTSPLARWTQVPFPYQTNATHVSVTLPSTARNKFYRLRKP